MYWPDLWSKIIKSQRKYLQRLNVDLNTTFFTLKLLEICKIMHNWVNIRYTDTHHMLHPNLSINLYVNATEDPLEE